MEKNNITPISCYSDSLVYEELNKEELKEAGVVIDYVGDEVVDCDIYKDYDNNYYGETFKGQVYIFNFAKNEFEEVSNLEEGLKLNNPKDYLNENNKLDMKLECDDEIDAYYPTIAIEGVVKNAKN